MKTEEVFKYAILAIGGYMLYKWLADNCYLAQFGIAGANGCIQTASGWQIGTVSAAAPVGTQPPVTAAPGTQQSVGQPPATVVTPPAGLTPAQAAAATAAAQTVTPSQLTAAATQLLSQAQQLRSVAAQVGQTSPMYQTYISEAQVVEAQAAAMQNAAATGSSTTIAPTQDALKQIQNAASLGDATSIALADQNQIRYNADQWNYIRVSAGGSSTSVDLFPAGNRGYLMLASEYIAARRSAGLSGLHGSYAAMRGMGGWTN